MVRAVYVHHCGHEECPRSTVTKHQSKPKGYKCASDYHVGSHEYDGKTKMFVKQENVDNDYIHKDVPLHRIEECEECGRLIDSGGEGGYWKSADDQNWLCSNCSPPEEKQENTQFA